MERMNRSEMVANSQMGAHRPDSEQREIMARQRSYEAKARATLAKLNARQVDSPRRSALPALLGILLVVGCATYGVGFVLGAW
jgi:hypothetical protein